MSRDRDGLPNSYHRDQTHLPEDYLVRTEFGCDAWTYVFRAGFSRVEMFAVSYPAAIAYLARNSTA